MKLKKLISTFLAAVVAVTALLSCGISASAADTVLGVALSESDDGYYIIDLYGLTRKQYRSLINGGQGFSVSIYPSSDDGSLVYNTYVSLQTYRGASSSMIKLQDYDGANGVFACMRSNDVFYDEQYSTAVLEFSSIYGDDRYNRSYGVSWRLNKRNEDVQYLHSVFEDAPFYLVKFRAYPTAEDYSETVPIEGLDSLYYVTNPNGKAIVSRETDISSLKFGKLANKAYTGKAITPDVTIKDGDKKLVNGTDYTLSYEDNKNPGQATITVTGKGDYSGTQELTFNIVPKKVKVTSKKSGSQAVLSWKKSTGAAGYEIYSSVNSGKFKKLTTSKGVQYTAKLTAGKSYKFKVRPYITVDGTKVYGSWSNTVTVK